MSKIEYKKEQLEVLNCNNKNLIVSASAGSGKTTVMIQKIINFIISENYKIKNILVLTYTKAAAEEMKQKLVNALYAQSKTNPKLLNQIDDIATSDISTIHSFFQKLVKKYFMYLDFNPHFVVLEENEAQKLKNQALKNIIELYTEKQPEKIKKIYEIYGKSRNEKTIFSLIEKINTFLVAIDNPYDWCTKVSTKFYDTDLTKNLAIEILNKNIFEVSNYFKRKFQKLQYECEKASIEKYVGYLNTILSQLEQIKNGEFVEKVFFQNCGILANFQFDVHKKVEGFEDKLIEINEAKKSLVNFCDKIKSYDYTFENVQKSLVEVKEIVYILLELTQDFQAEFTKLKNEKNFLDFNDLEKYSAKLLENPKIQEQIKNQYSKIFVDEYQDANRLQEKILSSISKINNRFMVGDVKQSIYGFRQAEPDIFLEMQDNFDNDSNSEVKFLNANYRSHKKILNFVNLIFNEIMTNQTASIDYKNSSNLNGEAEYEIVLEQDIPTVEINIIKRENKKDLLPPPNVYSLKEHTLKNEEPSTGKVEGFIVAKKIGELLGKKIYIPSMKCEKYVDFKDITILVAKRGKYFEDFCKVLVDFNIPIYANTNNSLYDEPEIQIFTSILKLCKNYQNDIALANCLHSVFGGFDNNELSKIRLANSDKTCFYECFDCYQFDDNIKIKIEKFKKLLEQLTFDINYQGIYYALNKIIDKYDYITYLLTKPNGSEKVAKLKKFVGDFLNNEYNNDLCGFLNFVEENGDNIKAPNFAGGENCVNITTIHSSKGLEFPIVIFANAGSDFTKVPQNTDIEINQKYGIGLKFYDMETRTKKMSIMFDAIKQINKSKEFAEKLRLLYVALTRAKNHLIIVGTTEGKYQNFESEFEVKNQTDYLSLMINSLNREEIDCINKNESVQNEDYTINVYDEVIMPEIFEKRQNLFGKSSEDYKNIFEKYFDFKYPNNNEITLKNSVSSLTQKVYETYANRNFSPKTFNISESIQTNIVDIGILYHDILEKIDFNKVNNINYINEFLKANYEEINIKKLNTQKIFNCIKLIKQNKYEKILKEQKFMMYIPHEEIVKNGSKEKILIQGIIDLILMGEKNILIDYKYSHITDENKLINKYFTQLKLYKIAVEKVLGKRIDEIYLLNLFTENMIKVSI